MHRRNFLAAVCSGLAATGGCLSARGSNAPTVTPDAGATALSPGETATVGGDALAVQSVAVQASVVTSYVHTDVVAEAGTQYVLAEVDYRSGDARNLDDRSLSLSVDGERNPGGGPFEAGQLAAGADALPTVVFPVPVGGEPATAAVVWDPADGERVRWALSPSQRRALGRAPSFEVREFAVPATTDSATVAASLTVANVGDRDGTFRAELGSTYLSDQGEVFVAVPSGASVTREEDVRLWREEPGEETVRLDWGVDSMERTVRHV